MHSIESLRRIRSMRSFLESTYRGIDYQENHVKPYNYDGEVIATARYNLETREITIIPADSRDNQKAL